MKHEFKLENENVTVYVNQTHKTVWEASGSFEGHALTVKGSSGQNALARWRKVALRHAD